MHIQWAAQYFLDDTPRRNFKQEWKNNRDHLRFSQLQISASTIPV